MSLSLVTGRQGKDRGHECLEDCKIAFCVLTCRKTAIAIDTIINQKRFNDGDDESELLLLKHFTRIVLFLFFCPQRKSCIVYMLPLVRREVQLPR